MIRSISAKPASRILAASKGTAPISNSYNTPSEYTSEVSLTSPVVTRPAQGWRTPVCPPSGRTALAVLDRPLVGGLGDAEIDYFWNGRALLFHHEYVRRFKIAVDYAFWCAC